jgi:hypothetical protein
LQFEIDPTYHVKDDQKQIQFGIYEDKQINEGPQETNVGECLTIEAL